jgi:predicted nucleic acid-binding protein
MRELNVFIDTSVLVTILFKESGYKKLNSLIEQATEILACNLLEAELLSVMAREKRPLADALEAIKHISLFMPDRSLADEYKKIFNMTFCRGADAYHLACALFLDPQATELIFLTQDNKQQKSAEKVGFKIRI